MAGKGGYRPNSGRKSKAEELGIREKLAPMEPAFLKAIHREIKKGNSMALKIFSEYMYGKPKETVEVMGKNGQPIETESKHVVEFRDYGGDNTVIQSAIQAGIRN